MNAKSLILDFINLVFLIILVGFVIVFFIAGDRFESFIHIMKSLVPIAIYGIIFMIMIKIKRMQLQKWKSEGRESSDKEIVIYLSFMDKYILDILLYLMPIVILVTAFFLEDKVVNFTDILQATVAFLMMAYSQRLLFKNKS